MKESMSVFRDGDDENKETLQGGFGLGRFRFPFCTLNGKPTASQRFPIEWFSKYELCFGIDA